MEVYFLTLIIVKTLIRLLQYGLDIHINFFIYFCPNISSKYGIQKIRKHKENIKDMGLRCSPNLFLNNAEIYLLV